MMQSSNAVAGPTREDLHLHRERVIGGCDAQADHLQRPRRGTDEGAPDHARERPDLDRTLHPDARAVEGPALRLRRNGVAGERRPGRR